MPSCSIVTLSGFADIFQQFAHSAAIFEPEARKIVVTSRGLTVAALGWSVVQGIEPFAFARNANLGIRAAGRDDVLLVNDDVQFLQHGTLAALRREAYEHPEVGILSPQFLGTVGNRMQSRRRRLVQVTYSQERLCFTCVYIRRAVLDAVGELDERFVGYGSEDDEFCWRVQAAGWKLGVTPDAVVRHGFGLLNATASFSRVLDVDRSADEMRVLFEEKRRESHVSTASL